MLRFDGLGPLFNPAQWQRPLSPEPNVQQEQQQQQQESVSPPRASAIVSHTSFAAPRFSTFLNNLLPISALSAFGSPFSSADTDALAGVDADSGDAETTAEQTVEAAEQARIAAEEELDFEQYLRLMKHASPARDAFHRLPTVLELQPNEHSTLNPIEMTLDTFRQPQFSRTPALANRRSTLPQ